MLQDERTWRVRIKHETLDTELVVFPVAFTAREAIDIAMGGLLTTKVELVPEDIADAWKGRPRPEEDS